MKMNEAEAQELFQYLFIAELYRKKQSQSLIFKGGTLLALCVYPSFRFSEDIDFDIAGAVNNKTKRLFSDAAKSARASNHPINSLMAPMVSGRRWFLSSVLAPEWGARGSEWHRSRGVLRELADRPVQTLPAFSFRSRLSTIAAVIGSLPVAPRILLSEIVKFHNGILSSDFLVIIFLP